MGGGEGGGRWEFPVVGSLRIGGEEDVGREISYRIEIEKGQLPVENGLVLLIPKSYPFH